MKLKKITAATIQDALAIARRELGDEAVLLETKEASSGKGVVVTFAVDTRDEVLFDDDLPAILPYARAASPSNHPARDAVHELLRQTCAYHHLPTTLTQKLIAHLPALPPTHGTVLATAQAALADALAATLTFQPLTLADAPLPTRALMLLGGHGAGKTSTIAKLATQLTMLDQPVTIISTDKERMGGIESLQQLTSILKCDFHSCETRAQLILLLKHYVGKSWVLIDSTGANIYEFAHMKTLGEFASLQAVEPILVCPAGMDADEAHEMAGVFDFLPIERMIITRLDAVRRLHGVFAALTTGRYALANFSDSAAPSDGCQPLTATALAQFMLRHAREKLSH